MYEIKTKVKGEQLINFFYEAIDEVLKKKGISNIRREKICSEIGLLVSAKLAGFHFEPSEEIIFENVERAEIKKRLTQKQRRELFQLEMMYAVVRSFAEQFDRDSILTKENAKFVKIALSFIEKVIHNILTELEEKEKQKYQNWAKKFRVAFLDEESVLDRKIVEKLEKYADKYVLSEEEFLDLAENAIEVRCKGCQKEDYEKCRFYTTMYELNVDPQNFTDGCPYKL